ncbi:hypothetical protein QE416_002508 [Microbacterium sp. SORGH_AS 421]|nr:hypothetical protein [Microbacterium sp. SORGH_AS_0421]
MATITLTVTVDITVTDELGHSFTFYADRALYVLTQALQSGWSAALSYRISALSTKLSTCPSASRE